MKNINKRWVNKLFLYKTADSLKDDLLSCLPFSNVKELKRLAVVGASDWGLKLLDSCEHNGISIAGIFDDDKNKWHKPFAGTHISPIKDLVNLEQSIPVIITSHRITSIYNRLRSIGFKNVWSMALLASFAPSIFPQHSFYDGLIDDLFENRNSYLKLYNLLCDDKSKRVLNAIIGFRMTLNPSMLTGCIDPNLYFPSGLFRFNQHEVFVDGGAYNGDSIEKFIIKTRGKFDRIFAFEPDPLIYKELFKRYCMDARLIMSKSGLFSKKCKLKFNSTGKRDSKINDLGDIFIPVLKLDDVVKEKVSYIKLNIEGAEYDAVMGARKIIWKFCPKLAISVYHRPSDLWRIPFLAHKIFPGYRFYLRQHDGGIVETVLYAKK